jgi:hypothetical protein
MLNMAMHAGTHLPGGAIPGLGQVVLTCPGTLPCVSFLFPWTDSGQAYLIALRSGFLRRVPRGSVPGSASGKALGFG